MAKLSVVVPSNEVEVEGVKYRKVERKAQAGDIVKALTDFNIDVAKGAFYPVIKDGGETGFYDDNEDFRHAALRLRPERFEVYEKVAQEYREVNRKAEKGERIRIVNAILSGDSYKNGDEFTVKKATDTGVTLKESYVGVWHKEYVVLEPVNVAKLAEPAPQPERLKVGDYVKVTDDSGAGDAKKGDIAVVTDDNWGGFGGGIIDVKTLDGRTYGMFAQRFVRATESEVEAAKKSLERTKKIGEFADGGYAEIVNAKDGNATTTPRNNNGAYVRVHPQASGNFALKVTFPDSDYGYCNADALRKVTREEYEEATKPRLKAGDKVKITRFQYGAGVGTIVTVTSVDSKCVISYDGGYLAGSDSYEVLTAEEVARIAEEAKWAAIGRKVDEFKAGDVVEVTRGCGGHSNGTIGICDGQSHEAHCWVIANGRRFTGAAKLLVPVEQRFDRPEGGASPSK